MKFYYILIIGVLTLTGCAKLAHLEQLLTIKGFSENKDEQARYVEERDQKFEELLLTAKENQLYQYPDQKSFEKKFGQPILKRQVQRENRDYQLWLYRYSVKYFNSEKVYLYFDDEGVLKDWELFEPENISS